MSRHRRIALPAAGGPTRVDWREGRRRRAAIAAARHRVRLLLGRARRVPGSPRRSSASPLVVCVFTVRDFRVGVLVMIFIMPIVVELHLPARDVRHDGPEPAEPAAGRHPRVVHAGARCPTAPCGASCRCWILPVYILPLILAGAERHGQRGRRSRRSSACPSRSTSTTRSATCATCVLKPLIIVMYALLVGAAVRAQPRAGEVPHADDHLDVDHGALVIVFFLNSGVCISAARERRTRASSSRRWACTPTTWAASTRPRSASLLFTWDRTASTRC